MGFGQICVYFLSLFGLALVVGAIVTFLYSLIAHGIGVVDWETAFRLALILSVVLTVMKAVSRSA